MLIVALLHEAFALIIGIILVPDGCAAVLLHNDAHGRGEQFVVAHLDRRQQTVCAEDIGASQHFNGV